MRPGAAWLKRRFGGQADRVRLAYRQAFDQETSRGRLLLADLAALCHATTTSFVPKDPQATAFAEGKRAVLLHILDVLGLSAVDLATVERVPSNDSLS